MADCIGQQANLAVYTQYGVIRRAIALFYEATEHNDCITFW